jgi:SPP1 family predicted phage head-tail adaptor
MRAGDLNKYVTIQYPALSKNSFGEEIETWVDHVNVWCSIEPISGSEKWLQQQRVSEATYKIRMRYRLGIDERMRIKYKNRNLQFLAVLNLYEESREIFIAAKEVV